MGKNKSMQQLELMVTFDVHGPTLDELYHSPEVFALFEGILLTRKLLKPEFRGNRQPVDGIQEEVYLPVCENGMIKDHE